MTELDIWRTAHPMIEQHGDQAELQAAVKADHRFANGDATGCNICRRIVTAITDLCEENPSLPGTRH